MSALNLIDITFRNFLSVGAVTQAVKLNGCELTLILGKNADTPGENGKNGVGKTLLLQGISFVLFGEPISTKSSDWKLDRLVNNINDKNMLVTLNFEKDGIKYKIERGRKPNIFRFYINGKDQTEKSKDNTLTDETKGGPKQTQADIEAILGMSHLIFTHIVGMNTYTEPFLKMQSMPQKTLIEELLGISLLTHRDDHFKELIKESKRAIDIEEAKIKTLIDGNQRIDNAIQRTRNDAQVWEASRVARVNSLSASLEKIRSIDFESELEKLQEIEAYNEFLKQTNTEIDNVRWKIDEKRTALNRVIQKMTSHKARTNIDSHIDRLQNDLIKQENILGSSVDHHINSLTQAIEANHAEILSVMSKINAVTEEIAHFEEHLASDDHFCNACGQKFNDENQLQEAKLKIGKQLEDRCAALERHLKYIDNLQSGIDVKQRDIDKTKETHEENLKVAEQRILEIGNEIEALLDSKAKEELEYEAESERANAEIKGLQDEISNLTVLESDCKRIISEKTKPVSYYRNKEEVWALREQREQLARDLATEETKPNPHEQNIANLESTKQELSYTVIEDLRDDLAHQEFIHKLLSGKDSFVRKKIIDQNLYFLNTRTNNYLERLGLDHEVRYMSDLSVEITLAGNSYDFPQLSTGQRGRVILATAWAFRDIWENLNHSINLLFIDELIDSGMDDLGAEAALAILNQMSKERKRNIFLVSHKEFLVSKVDHTLLVHYESRFTRFEEDGVL